MIGDKRSVYLRTTLLCSTKIRGFWPNFVFHKDSWFFNEVEGNVRLQIIANDKKVLFDMTYVSQS
jgi:hypothetical protein